jgi:hypothetical protein
MREQRASRSTQRADRGELFVLEPEAVVDAAGGRFTMSYAAMVVTARRA